MSSVRISGVGMAGLVLVGLWACGDSSPASASGEAGGEEWIRDTGDILQIALPVLGGAATFFTNPEPGKSWDREGTRQFVYAYGAAWSTTYGLKFLMSKARPNGDNRTSFPSGHTMSAFAGAAFIDGRFGKAWGIPAYLLAGFTGYSRVQSQWHYRDDVLAGASIGMLYSWHFVTPQPGRVSVLPTVSGRGLGLAVSIGAAGPEVDDAVESVPRGHGYDFSFGPAFLISNEVASRGDGGTPFQLGDLEGNNDPTTTAAVTASLRAGSKGRVNLSWGPFEARDRGAFDQDVSFGGEVFAAGEAVTSAWRFYDARGSYGYLFVDSGPWRVIGGAGIGVVYSYAALSTADESRSALVDDTTVYPYLLTRVTRRLDGRLGLEVAADGVTTGSEWMLNASLALTWRASRAWDFKGGYTYLARKIETDTYFNDVQYGVPGVSVVRYW